MAFDNSSKLIFIRHGHSQHSAQGVIAGLRTCQGLTQQGEVESQVLGAGLLNTFGRPSRVLSSPVERAIQTARIATAAAGLSAEIERDLRLTEPDPGRADGLNHDEVDAQFDTFDLESHPDRPLAPDGESWNDFQRRTEEFILTRDPHAGDAWVFTHAGFMVSIFRALFGARGSRARLEFPNASALTFEHTDVQWVLHSYTPLALLNRD